MKLTDEQIEQMALEAYPVSFERCEGIEMDWNEVPRKKALELLKQARDIYEKEIQRLNIEILTMTDTIDELRDELKRLK